MANPTRSRRRLLRDLKWRFGAYPLGLEAKRLGLRSPDAAILEERLLRSVGYKACTAHWLLEREGWDLAVIGFCELHPAGHYLWPDGADTIGGADDALFRPLFNAYAAIDGPWAPCAIASRMIRHSWSSAETVCAPTVGAGTCFRWCWNALATPTPRRTAPLRAIRPRLLHSLVERKSHYRPGVNAGSSTAFPGGCVIG